MAGVDTPLSVATRDLRAQLAVAAASGDLGRVAADALGLLSVPESLWTLQDAWSAGLFSDFPAITAAPGSAMANARGAYVAETAGILVNQDWLATASESELLAVLAEEVGHHLDARFNSSDTPGDEGELFSRLLLGQLPSASERTRITSDNDAIQVTLANGTLVSAEAAAGEGSELAPSDTVPSAQGLEESVAVSPSSSAPESEGIAQGTDGDGTVITPSAQPAEGDLELISRADTQAAVNDSPDQRDASTINLPVSGSAVILDAAQATAPLEAATAPSTLPVTATGAQSRSVLPRSTLALAELENGIDRPLRLNGTAQYDYLVGGRENDLLFGMGSDDELVGGAGNDYLDGGNGSDNMVGGLGDDIYVVDSSSDVVIEGSGEGKDSVMSMVSFGLPSHVENLDLRVSGRSTGVGNDLDNVIYGGFGSTSLSGGAGDDSLYGRGAYDDYLEGGIGNDFLDAGQGADIMVGGDGNDTYIVRDSRAQLAEAAGAGSDWVYATTYYALSENVENIQLIGSTDGLYAVGNAQNNTLIGDKWSNQLMGGAGDDFLNGGVGADQMDGGLGNDTYVVDSSTDTTVELSGEGTDWVASTVSHTLASNVENLDLQGVAALTGSGNVQDNIIKGNAGANNLYGGAGNDSLYDRGTGSDSLFGEDGDDYLDGGLGADTLDGGSGNDTYVVDNVEDQVSEGVGLGTDWVLGSVSYTLGDNLEGLLLRGTDNLNGSGNALDNTIYGNAGSNGLSGGAGNDILNGGAGSDTLLGGDGSDLFVIASREADGTIVADHIGDFQTGKDVLYLSRTALGIDPVQLGAGVLKSTDFNVVTSRTEGGLEGAKGLASTAAFVFDQSSGILYHNSNGSEFGEADYGSAVASFASADLKASDIQVS